MNLLDYQDKSARTMNFDASFPEHDNYILGLFGEGGEFTDILKKDKYHGHGLDMPSKKKIGLTVKEELTEEIGDALWYCAAIATDMQINLNEIHTLCVPFDKHSVSEICRFYFYHAVQIDHYREHLIERKHLPLELEIDNACLVYHLAHTVGCLFAILVHIQVPIIECLIDNVEKLEKRYPEKFSQQDSQNRD